MKTKTPATRVAQPGAASITNVLHRTEHYAGMKTAALYTNRPCPGIVIPYSANGLQHTRLRLATPIELRKYQAAKDGVHPYVISGTGRSKLIISEGEFKAIALSKFKPSTRGLGKTPAKRKTLLPATLPAGHAPAISGPNQRTFPALGAVCVPAAQ